MIGVPLIVETQCRK